jgi:uncharacterized protein (TIGR03435 family)
VYNRRVMRIRFACVGLLLAAAGGAMLIGFPEVPRAFAQSATPGWEAAAGGKMSFDVVSVKRNMTSADLPYRVNMPIEDSEVFVPTGGLFRADNIEIKRLMWFAYKMSQAEIDSLHGKLPEWAVADRFDVVARGPANATKDQMRLMMQSLLADRFKLAIHTEMREIPVFAAVLVKAGETGPQLRAHPADAQCPTAPQPTPPDAKFPVACGAIHRMQPTVMGRFRFGARNVAMADVVYPFDPWGKVGRPVLDQTGLSGKFDFSVEFVPQLGPTPDAQDEPAGPTVLEALRDQLGLKLKSTTSSVQVVVIDHMEEPTPN